jgi:hypothetical protein
MLRIYRSPIADYSPGNAPAAAGPTSPRAPGTENAESAKRRTLSYLHRPTGRYLMYSPGNAENAEIAASAGNGKRQTPNAFLSPPTNGTLFDVLITDYRLPITD